MLQEEKLEIEKADAEVETKVMAANPDLWMRLYGDQRVETFDENNIFLPSTDEDFEEMLAWLDAEGWTEDKIEAVT